MAVLTSSGVILWSCVPKPNLCACHLKTNMGEMRVGERQIRFVQGMAGILQASLLGELRYETGCS